MEITQSLSLFEAVRFNPALEEIFIKEDYPCSKRFSPKEIAQTSQEGSVMDFLVRFHRRLPKEQQVEICELLVSVTLIFLERSGIGKAYKQYREIFEKQSNGTFSEEDAIELKERARLAFDEIGHSLEDDTEAMLLKGASAISGMIHPDHTYFTPSAICSLLFGAHESFKPSLIKRMGMDYKLFTEGKLIKRDNLFRDVYDIITK